MDNITEDIIISYQKYNAEIEYDVISNKFVGDDVTLAYAMKYLKGIFTNKSRFKKRFINELLSVYPKLQKQQKAGELEAYKFQDIQKFKIPKESIDNLLEIYDQVEPFTYEDAFAIKNLDFQSKVFGSIDITEMIRELGNKRIKIEGKPVRHKKYNSIGEFTGYEEYDVIYETYEVNGEKLGLDEKLYCLKCWCTTTNEEHWLWIDDKFKDQPLEAVASTFMIHENLIPHIKELKRQGDILLVEMKPGHEDILPEGEMISLSSDKYFKLLTAQS